jgi:hypothetical protein
VCVGGLCGVWEGCVVCGRVVRCTGGLCSAREGRAVRGRGVQCAGGACSVQEGRAVRGRGVRHVRVPEGHAGSPEVIITNYYIIIINYII